MKDTIQEYYMKQGKLDLSTLDRHYDLQMLVDGQTIVEENHMPPLTLYKDGAIEDILREMGQYFSAD